MEQQADSTGSVHLGDDCVVEVRGDGALALSGVALEEWLTKGAQLITIAVLSAEIAALTNHADPECEEPHTQATNDRADKALREAVGHLSIRIAPRTADNEVQKPNQQSVTSAGESA